MISFVYFDLGGVVEKDFSASNKGDELREELGILPSSEYEQFWKDVEPKICTTETVDSLLPTLKEKFGAKIPENYSLLNAFVRRFEKNESIWPVIEKMHRTTKIGLLTMMYPGMRLEIEKSGILPNIQWDIIIDSSEVGLVKSDSKMFIVAQEKAGVVGNEILYIENSKKYLPIAKELGWQTFFYDSINYEKSSQDLAAFWSSLTS